MAQKRDFYDVLGIPKTASEDEIRKSYRQLAKKYHPDVSDEKNAEDKFKEVQEAYDTLGDSEKRATYDQYGHTGSPFGGAGGGAGFEGFGGFGDIFEQFFGGGRTAQKQNKTGPRRGRDMEQKVTLDFMEGALGVKKTIRINRDEDCPVCDGRGARKTSDVETCNQCHGQGYINIQERTMLGTFQRQSVCPTCRGSGEIITNPCSSCNGKKRVTVNKSVDVTIPPGVDTNMTLRLQGQGEGGHRGAPNGDVYLVFQVRKHKVFERQGEDIFLTAPISFPDAALGTTLDIPTIHGDVSLKVPAGVQSGTKLRMRNQGVQKLNSKSMGDQYVIIEVETPQKLNPEEKKIYESLAGIYEPKKRSSWQKFIDRFK